MDDKINMEVCDCPNLIQHFANYELPSDYEALDPGEEQEVNRVRRGRLAGSTDGQLDECRAPVFVGHLDWNGFKTKWTS